MLEIKIDPNSRLNRENIESIKESILEYGYDESKPILIDEDGWILDGNHRYVALYELEMEANGVYFQIGFKAFLKAQYSLMDKYEVCDCDKIDDEIYYSEIIPSSQSFNYAQMCA
jgi:hypothetical protein